MKKIILFALCIFTLLIIFRNLKSSVTDKTDNYIYNLPFQEGANYKIVQGYGGLFSHYHIAALDFDMPIGSPVYAAREGYIYTFKNDSNEGGPFSFYAKKANYIIIKHKDGSYGCYWHLKQNGVVVTNGYVEKGQLIGYSGNTGFVLAPHLHFSVKNKLNYDKGSYVKTKFETNKGVSFLQYGVMYSHPTKTTSPNPNKIIQ